MTQSRESNEMDLRQRSACPGSVNPQSLVNGKEETMQQTDWIKVSFGRDRKDIPYCHLLIAPLQRGRVFDSEPEYTLEVVKQPDYAPHVVNIRFPISTNKGDRFILERQGIRFDLRLLCDISPSTEKSKRPDKERKRNNSAEKKKIDRYAFKKIDRYAFFVEHEENHLANNKQHPAIAESGEQVAKGKKKKQGKKITKDMIAKRVYPTPKAKNRNSYAPRRQRAAKARAYRNQSRITKVFH